LTLAARSAREVVVVPCDQLLEDRCLVTGESVVNIHADFTASPRAAGQARALVRSALSGAGTRSLSTDVLHTAQLVASELVTNAVMHARTDLHLGLCCDEHNLLIAVADGAPEIDEGVASPDFDDESGRGMLIVASVAADFGWRRRTDRPGKIMWVLLALDSQDGSG
jgi:anti-sigma regulatory factor (Ser/Thr protein kinase)